MIKAYSQRLMPPYSGQMQVVESDRARALTLDSQIWEIQFLYSQGNQQGPGGGDPNAKRSYKRVATIKDSDIRQKTFRASLDNGEAVDERIVELTDYLADVSLPFPAADIYEYWLLDRSDQAPLALIFSCVEAEQMKIFPERPEWTALPAAVMPIVRSSEEESRGDAPVNYQVERLVADRAGYKPRAKWFTRRYSEDEYFPPLMLTDDWPEQDSAELCKRYLERQSPRLLMLHGLGQELRKQLEINARSHALEVERFYPLYPEVVDVELMDAIRVEAKLRGATEDQPAINKRRDGILYL